MPDHIKPLPDPEPQKPRRRWPLYLLSVLIVLALLAAFLLTKTRAEALAALSWEKRGKLRLRQL